MRPTARGTVKLASADPFAAPFIDPNYLATEEDRQDMRLALRHTMEIMEQEALTDFRLRRLEPQDIASDDAADVRSLAVRWLRIGELVWPSLQR